MSISGRSVGIGALRRVGNAIEATADGCTAPRAISGPWSLPRLQKELPEEEIAIALLPDKRYAKDLDLYKQQLEYRLSWLVDTKLFSELPPGLLRPSSHKLRAVLPEGMSLPELALRFILHHPAVTTTIPGMRRVAHVRANLAASDGRALAPELVEALRAHRWKRDWQVA